MPSEEEGEKAKGIIRSINAQFDADTTPFRSLTEEKQGFNKYHISLTKLFFLRDFQISPFVGPELEAELVGLCSNVRGVRWHPDFTDLIPADGGKPRGIQRFMAHYGITREQTMAFGDGGNDTDMLAYAGIGVAMGNATAEPKAAADYITDDVDHDGVRNALLHFRVLRD